MSGAVPTDRPVDGAVYAALPTFFEASGRIAAKAQAHLAEYLGGLDLDGFLLLSEAAEVHALTESEQAAVVADLAPRLGGRPFWVQLSSPSTRAAIALAERAERAGAEALLLQPYLLPGLGYRELYRHLELISRQVSLPFVLGLRALSALSALAPEELDTIAAHPRVQGIFLAGLPLELTRAWAKSMEGARFGVAGACALSCRASLKAGARMNLCALSTLASAQAIELREAHRAGAYTVLEDREATLKPLVDQLGPPKPARERGGLSRIATRIADRSLSGDALAPLVPVGLLKEALRLQGHPLPTQLRPPQEAARAEDRARLQSLLRVCGI